MGTVREAALNALAYLEQDHANLLNSYCLQDGDGKPVRASADGADAAHLEQVESVIAALRAALSPRSES